jgi:hypothetical protein
MSFWVSSCQRIYRRVARTFPYEFRMICGDGLERLGEDMVPRVWRQWGVVGIVRLLADVALRLPYEYLSTWIAKLTEVTVIEDLLEGTWKGNNEKSKWDQKYTPEEAYLRFEATETGYVLFAYGIKDGQAVAERPRPIFPDGKRRPVVDLNGRPIPGVPPGAMAYGSRPDPYTIEGWVEADGKVLGGGTYKISEDGNTLTVTSEGMGMKGPFKVVAVFDRVVPDPYTPPAEGSH